MRTGRVRVCVEWLYTVYAAVALCVCLIVWTPLALALPGRALRRRAGRLAVRCALALAGVRVRTTCREPLPAGAVVVVCNHASYLDGPVLFAALPPRFAFVIKREAGHVPLMGLVLRRLGHEFVDRFNRQRGAIDARRILRLAANGESIAFFPEGTFVPEPGIGRFHTGAFLTAVRAGVPVVPVAIRGTRHILAPGSPRLRPGAIDVEVLGVADVPDGTEERTRALADAARDRILAATGEPDRSGRGHG
jgi:1-acyl-sn-glycerol-3-phosphate acyltransferase